MLRRGGIYRPHGDEHVGGGAIQESFSGILVDDEDIAILGVDEEWLRFLRTFGIIDGCHLRYFARRKFDELPDLRKDRVRLLSSRKLGVRLIYAHATKLVCASKNRYGSKNDNHEQKATSEAYWRLSNNRCVRITFLHLGNYRTNYIKEHLCMWASLWIVCEDTLIG